MSDIKTFTAGDNIITKGAPATTAYMIMKGTVEVYLEENNKIVSLAKLAVGSIIGESALFGAEEYGANIKAIGDAELLVITPETFKEKLENCDPMIREIITTLIERQRKTNETLLKRETQEFMDIALI